MTDPKIDRSVQVSREDYDRMADQRDAFRAALVQAETYLAACKRTAASAEDSDCLGSYDGGDGVVDDLLAKLEQVGELATVGLRAVRKALKP